MSRESSQEHAGHAIAEARTNIALVKYWGKRQAHLNLPAVGSLSLTLEGLATRTEVRFDGSLDRDRFVLAGEPVEGKPAKRVAVFLDLVRGLARARAVDKSRASSLPFAEVRSDNNFPTASGLASSASGFAALALAATRAAGLTLDDKELSILARQGSGSAARSVAGGLVLLHRGERSDGSDCYAESILDPIAVGWDIRMVIAVAGEGPKATLSTSGMDHTAATSPFYKAWTESQPADLEAARQAVSRRDLDALGVIAERSCLTMHASAIAARPGVLYWTGATVDGFHVVRSLRARGMRVWFTNDAGPHVKALCLAADAPTVASALSEVPGISRTITCAPGQAACIVDESATSSVER